MSGNLMRWLSAVKQMEANPAIPVQCPICGLGTLVAEDVRSAADPDVGTRIIRCTHCGHHSEARVRFSRLASAKGVPAG